MRRILTCSLTKTETMLEYQIWVTLYDETRPTGPGVCLFPMSHCELTAFSIITHFSWQAEVLRKGSNCSE